MFQKRQHQCDWPPHPGSSRPKSDLQRNGWAAKRAALSGSLLTLALLLFLASAHSSAARSAPPICFWSVQGPVCVERAGVLETAAPEPEALLAALLAGPSPREQARGIWSAIPAGTTLGGVDIEGRSFTVRLKVPPGALRELDHATFEAIVEQIGWTLEPVGWRELYIQTWDPATESFVPLADFLPAIEPPRKAEAVALTPLPSPPPSAGRAGNEVSPTYTGQPPAPGQAQPQGALTGKTIYVSAGHGWQWNGTAWRTQRPVYQGFIEDHNNAEAVDQYLLAYLWNAGALAWPVRERDMNPSTVIVDNDAPGPGNGYAETGTWTTSISQGYNGGTYRYALTTPGAATATAVWTATLPADGQYAVYAWYRQWTNRAPDARYTVRHAGGSTEVVVNQKVHGNTWHYLGTYGFRGGEVATVTLSNCSNCSAYSSTAVIADAVRFGGGTFNSLAGIQTSAPYPPNKPWWETAAYYYVQRMGVNPSNYTDFNDVIARPIYARWEHAGTGDDAVYISWHTNGYNGTVRGTETYAHNGEGLPRTEGSLELRHTVHTELVHDIRAGWDPNWIDRGEKLKNLGELRLLWDDNPLVRMPGALVEIAFHDNPYDAAALKEPAFQMLAARAIYQGIVKYFEQRDGIDLTLLPEPPTHLAVQNVGGGRVRISWRPSPTDTVGLRGDAATGYRVYTSTSGIGWSNSIPVGNTTVYTLTGLVPGQLLFVRVTAVNAGGESFPTETLAVRVGDGAGMLLVSGFDRLNNTMLVPDYDPVEGYNLRMFLDRMNGYNYTVQHGEVISYPFDSSSNEAVRDGDVDLTDYTVVDWILGEESTQDETLSGTEQGLLGTFLDGGGALFISGAEIGWDLDYLGSAGDRSFYNNYLRADYVGDDAGTYQVAPVPGSIFDGLPSFRFDAAGMYDADYPDVIAPVNGSTAALTYSGGTGGVAAVQYGNGCRRLVHFGFPFEVIHPDHRAAVMGRVMDFLGLCLPPPVNTHITSPSDGAAYNTPPSFTGTAEAGGTATLSRVEVQVRRESDGAYWTGSLWSAAESWVTATGTFSWTYPLTMPLIDDSYRLRARARTTGGELDPSPAEVVFTYDTISPTATSLITPTGGVTIPGLPGVTLEWMPVGPDGGSPLAYRVELDGQPYTTTQSVYTLTQIADGPHTWGVQVFDAAGNRSGWVTDTFTISRLHLWLPTVLHDFVERETPCTDVILNGGFESDEGWTFNRLATYETVVVHTGARSVRVGIPPGEPGQYAYSSVTQKVTVPTGSTATLSMWVYPIGEGNDSGDWFYVGLFDPFNNYHSIEVWRSNGQAWEWREYDLSAYTGQTITLYIGARNDGDDDTAAMYVDDVALEVCPP